MQFTTIFTLIASVAMVSAAPQGAPQPNNPQPNPAPVTPAPVAGAGCPGGSPNHPTSALTNICCPVSLLPASCCALDVGLARTFQGVVVPACVL